MSWSQWSQTGNLAWTNPGLATASTVSSNAVQSLPAGATYTPEQWAAMQQQNWQQWMQWQQQYQQWQQQYGEQYQKSLGLSGQAPVPLMSVQPPLPGTNLNINPPLPEAKPPLPPEEPPNQMVTQSQSLLAYNAYVPSPSMSANIMPSNPSINVPPPQHMSTNVPSLMSNISINASSRFCNTSQPPPPLMKVLPPQHSPFQGESGTKRYADFNNDAHDDAKRNRWEENPTRKKSTTPITNVEELSEAEKNFDKQFEQWEAQLNSWKEQNAGHPDKQQYKEYEAKWEAWRVQLLERREQMRRKRLGLNCSTPQVKSSVSSPTPSSTSETNQTSNFNLQFTKPISEILEKDESGKQNFEQKSDNKLNDSDNDISYLFSQPPKEQRTNIRQRQSSTSSMDTSFLKSASADGQGIPGLDLVASGDNKLPDKKEEAKKIDYEAISKGINTILGDEKIMNMLSNVVKNKNIETPKFIDDNINQPVEEVSNYNYQSNDDSYDNCNFSNDSCNEPNDFTEDVQFGESNNFLLTNSGNEFDSSIRQSDNFNYDYQGDDSNNFTPSNKQLNNSNSSNRQPNNFGQNNKFEFNNRPLNRPNNFGQSNRPLNDFNQPNRPLNNFGQSNRSFNDFGQPNRPSNDFGQQNRPSNDFGQQNRPLNDFGQSNRSSNDFGQQNRPSNDFVQSNRSSNDFGFSARNSQDFNFPNRGFNDGNNRNRGSNAPNMLDDFGPPENFDNSNNFESFNQGGNNNRNEFGHLNQNISDFGRFNRNPNDMLPRNNNRNLNDFNSGPPNRDFMQNPNNLDEPRGMNQNQHNPRLNNIRMNPNDYVDNLNNRFPDNYNANQNWEHENIQRSSNFQRNDPWPSDRNQEYNCDQNQFQKMDNNPFNNQRRPEFQSNPPDNYCDKSYPFPNSRNSEMNNTVKANKEKYWDEALILKPVTVIDYNHKSLNKTDYFMEPVQTFDYGHKSNKKETEKEPHYDRQDKKYVDSDLQRSYRDYSPRPHEDMSAYRRKSYENRKYYDKYDKYSPKSSRHNKDYDEFSVKHNKYQDTFHNTKHDFHSKTDHSKDHFTDNFHSKNKQTSELKVIEKKSSATMIEDLLIPPGRNSRPPRIVIILRGPPGSGKTFLAKLIKDKEVEQGGCAPRILSLDDYFMVEQEKETVDEGGRKVVVKEMVYEYEECMEISYRQSLEKAFRKTITDGYFPFIILDCINSKNKHYAEMWSFAKQNGFQVYICQMELDVAACTKRNIHHRSEIEIERLVASWEETPNHYLKLDATSIIQSGCISEVEMEEVSDTDNLENDEDEIEQDHGISKWEKMEHSEDKLARLDGTNKPLRPRATMEDYLQLDDDYPENKPGDKRVRWADLEEKRQQEKMRAIGFVVGQTDWDRMMDPTQGSGALTQTKYIERVKKF